MSEQNKYLASIATHTNNMWSKLCELVEAFTPTPFIVTGADCNGVPVTAEATSTVQTVPHPDFVQKVQLCKPNVDPEVVCLSNDGGLTIVTGWEVFDVSVNPPTSTLYIGGVAVTGYEVVPCDKPMQYDYEKEVVCVDGKTWTKWYVWDKTGDGLPNLVTVLWIDETDTVMAAPDPLLINNVNCKVCLPTISDAFADDLSTLLPGTSFTITKPDCCRIQVVTSVGTITLREKETYYSTTDFKCPITITGITIVSGTCSLADIHIISNFNG